MMNSKSLAAITMVFLMLLCLPAQAEFGGIMSDIGPLDAYDDMLTFFELKDYDAARDVIKEYGLAKKHVEDAHLYSNYLDALAYMDIGKFDLAAYLFEGLMQGNASFLDSELLYHYCAGRHAQTKGDYDQAISSYTLSVTYGDSSQRLLDCVELRDQSMIVQAKDCYDTAVLLRDIDMMEAAALLYAQLGDAQMTQKIREEIRAIEKEWEYNGAVASMEKALVEDDKVTLSQLILYFDAQGEYKDCASLAQSCRDHLAAISRTLTFLESQVDITSLKVAWQDTVPGSSYVVRYAPANVQEIMEIIAHDQQVILTDLLPGTAYTITVMAEEDRNQGLCQIVETLPAQPYLAGLFSVRAGRLIGVKRSYLDFYTLEELLDTKQNALTYYDSNRLSLEHVAPSLQPTKHCFVFTYMCESIVEEPVEITWLLRTEKSGAYALKQPEPVMLDISGRLYLDLDTLLEPIFQQEGSWPAGTMILELYLDGLLGGKGAIILERE